MDNEQLMRDGTTEPVSQDQILRRVGGQGNINFPCSADHEQDWQPHPVDLYSAIRVMTMNTYIHTYIHRLYLLTTTTTDDTAPSAGILKNHLK